MRLQIMSTAIAVYTVAVTAVFIKIPSKKGGAAGAAEAATKTGASTQPPPPPPPPPPPLVFPQLFLYAVDIFRHLTQFIFFKRHVAGTEIVSSHDDILLQ